VIFSVTSIAFTNADTALVSGGYYEDGLSASGNGYVVKRLNRKWEVTEDWMN